MVGVFSLSAVVVSALAMAISVTALPTVAKGEVVDYAQILQPGHGLPSVASLNLTHADLIKPISNNGTGLDKRFNPTCLSQFQCAYSDALACYNYLENLGKTNCIAAPYSRFCLVNGCAFIGTVIDGSSSASSYCADVALGASWVLNNCPAPVAGQNTANGNGGLLVTINV